MRALQPFVHMFPQTLVFTPGHVTQLPAALKKTVHVQLAPSRSQGPPTQTPIEERTNSASSSLLAHVISNLIISSFIGLWLNSGSSMLQHTGSCGTHHGPRRGSGLFLLCPFFRHFLNCFVRSRKPRKRLQRWQKQVLDSPSSERKPEF